MSDTTYTFNFGASQQAKDTMQKITTSLQNGLHELENTVRTSLTEWDDDARDAYTIAQQQWDQRAQHMPTNLQTAIKGLDEIEQRYLQTINRGTQQWGGFSAK